MPKIEVKLHANETQTPLPIRWLSESDRQQDGLLRGTSEHDAEAL